MRAVAVALVLALLLTGCASPGGPLENGRWFLPTQDTGPVLLVAHSVANVGLGAVYLAAVAANFLRGLSSGKERSLDPMIDPPPIFPPPVVGP